MRYMNGVTVEHALQKKILVLVSYMLSNFVNFALELSQVLMPDMLRVSFFVCFMNRDSHLFINHDSSTSPSNASHYSSLIVKLNDTCIM